MSTTSIRRKDPTVVTALLKWLADCYDTEDKNLNVTRGPIHDYLGMNVEFSAPGTVAFNMTQYIKKNAPFPEKITGVSLTPTIDKLFKPEEAHYLPEEQARGSITLPPNSFPLPSLSRHSNNSSFFY